MAWTTPITWTTGAVLTAAQLNQQLRDNMNETAPAKFTAASQIFVSTGANAGSPRTVVWDYVGSAQTTTSSSFVDLATVGPTVTATTGVQALVCISARLQHGTANANSYMGYAVSGATTIAAVATSSVASTASAGGSWEQQSYVLMQGSLTAGSNTFQAKYQTNTGTATFDSRRLTVLPF